MGNNKYKTLSQCGNVLFFSWSGRNGEPKDAETLKRYGKHISTYFPELNEWYKNKVNFPEKWQKI